jgi:hypothetical protein
MHAGAFSFARIGRPMAHASSATPTRRRISATFALLALLSAGVSACSKDEAEASSDGSGGSGTGTGGSSSTGGGSGDATAHLFGTFSVSLVEPVAANGDTPAVEGFTSILGKVFDGPTPEATIWELSAEKGDCRLLEPRVPFCDPACGTAVCVEDGECQARPTSVALGTVTVSGVTTDAGGTEVSMDPIANTYQPGASVHLPFPAFDAGAPISIAAEGGELGPFSVEAKAIAPLELSSEALLLTHDAPLVLNWTAGDVPEARITVKLDISHHGGSKGKIECETSDTGQLELDAELVSSLLDLGVAGFPTVIVTRKSVGANGGVQLVVSSTLERAVEIEGLASCNEDADCPDGVCRADLTCGDS